MDVRIQAALVVAAGVFLPFGLFTLFIWRELSKLRKDVIHAGIDIHSALMEQLVMMRLQSMTGQLGAQEKSPDVGSGLYAIPQPASHSAQEAELWLEKQRERMKR